MDVDKIVLELKSKLKRQRAAVQLTLDHIELLQGSPPDSDQLDIEDAPGAKAPRASKAAK